jgi:hypothetical protein
MDERALEAAARAIAKQHAISNFLLPDESHADTYADKNWDVHQLEAQACIAAYREASEEARDAARLHFWFWEGVDGFKGLPMDKYEYACEVAARNGREEPNEDDELQGFREFTDAAMAVFAQEGK